MYTSVLPSCLSVPEKGVRSFGTGVTVFNCHASPGIEPGSSGRAANVRNHGAASKATVLNAVLKGKHSQ